MKNGAARYGMLRETGIPKINDTQLNFYFKH